MALQLVLALAGAMLVGSPDEGTTTPPQGSSTAKLAGFASAVGHVLGGATACDEIPPARVQAAAEKASHVAAAMASDDDELTVAQEAFESSAAEGSQAVTSGKASCDQVSAALTKLEEVVSK